VIGFALVAIIGILPMGMQVQKDNRQETIINQEATIFMDAIRNGGHALDYLTNYVYAITNYSAEFNLNTGAPVAGRTVGYTYNSSSETPDFWLTNGSRIVGLLSTPKYQNPSPNGVANNIRSNHFVAFVRAMSGAASEKYPQTNADIQASSFSYRMYVDVVPYSDFDRTWTNYTDPTLYTPGTNAAEIARRLDYFMTATNMQNNLFDVRLTFRWPLDAKGNFGAGRQVFRTLAGGRLTPKPDAGVATYFMESRTYGKAGP
jgi:hypothetical protein